jgi:8-oxo-dGTP diphosphatase
VTGTGFTDGAAWFVSLPVLYAAAAALMTDTAGHVLLVKPNYRDHWSLPGESASTASRPMPRVPVKSVRNSGSISMLAGCW